MRIKTAQFAFIFQELFDVSHEVSVSRGGVPCGQDVSGSLSLSLIYDDGLDLIDRFTKAFPGRSSAPIKSHEKNAMARLSKLLKELVDDGWIDRFRISNFKEYVGEGGTWSYGYTLPLRTYRKMKSGEWSAESMARRYQGDDTAALAAAEGVEP